MHNVGLAVIEELTTVLNRHLDLKMKTVVAFLVLLSWTFSVQAINKSVVIAQREDMQLIGEELQYYEDKTQDLSIEEVIKLSDQGEFQRHGKVVFNRSSGASYFWFQLTVKNETGEDLWLQVGDAFSTWYLDFYAPNSKSEYGKPLQLGSLRPQENKLFPSNYYCVPLAKGSDNELKTFYLRVSGSFPKTHVFQIGTKLALTKLTKKHNYVVAAFVGVMLSMIIYNLFLLFSIRERVYLYYVAYLICILVMTPFAHGHPLFYADWFWNYYFSIQVILALMINLFTIRYLNLYEVSRGLSNWLWVIMAFIILSGVLNLLLPNQLITIVNVTQPVLLLHSISLLGSGIYAMRRYNRNAQFYVLGWVFVIGSIALFLLTVNGIVPVNYVSSNAFYIGFSLEAVMFALALGDRWKQEKTKQLALEKTIEKNVSELQQQTSHMINMSNHMSDTERNLKAMMSQPSPTQDDIQKILSGFAVSRSMEKEWNQFESYFSKLHGGFNETLILKHQDLSQQERKLCLLIKMELNNREISGILNIAPKSVGMGRYRLKKKLGLNEEEDLQVYIQSF